MLDWLLRLLGLIPAEPPARRRRSVSGPARSPSGGEDSAPTVAEGSHERDLVGEASYADGLRKLMRGSGVERRGEWEAREVLVHLVREPTNKFDRNAVRADVDWTTVGYVPRDEVGDFGRIFEALGRDRLPLTCRGRIIGKEGRFGVKLLVTDPLRLASEPAPERRSTSHRSAPVQLTAPPKATEAVPVITGGTRVAVMGEEAHQAELRRALADRSERRVMGELREQAGELLVFVEGQVVGHLSDRVGPRYLPMVREAAAAGAAVTCWADLTQGVRKIELYVMLKGL